MNPILPSSVSKTAFDRALLEFAAVLGEKWVLTKDEDRASYLDAYAIGNGADHVASAAVVPKSVEEVQEILRIANLYRIPLWPVSRGKNLGYGGAAPLLSGSVMLDLGRMNRIHEVDEKFGYVVLEPGVSFFDLFTYLRNNKIALWLSAPGYGSGSVIGNALERGLGFTPYGDHTTKLCGLEVVLPSGEIIRTGMGAMASGKCWHHYQFGFGPHWDQLFVQSNFGVVTRAGMWLMPEPEATLTTTINLADFDDIGWFIDEMAQLRLRGVFEQPLVCGNYLRDAMVFSRRADWHKGSGPIPEAASKRIMEHFKTGWWKAALTLFGNRDVIGAQAELVRRSIEPQLKTRLQFQTWNRGDPIEGSGAGLPSLLSSRIVNWHGGRGGHIGFSPVMPPDGKLVLEQARSLRKRFDEFGFDYYASFTLGHRHINNINLIIFDGDDTAMTNGAKNLFKTMMADTVKKGYGEYRTHLEFMQLVADSYDFNDCSIKRLNEKVKDTLDPNGVLAPGKNGIWPKFFRDDLAADLDIKRVPRV